MRVSAPAPARPRGGVQTGSGTPAADVRASSGAPEAMRLAA